VTTEEGNTFEVTSILFPQTGITVKDTRGGSITLKASDYLPFKAGDQPIPRNGMVEGFVIGVAGLPKSEVVKKDTRLTMAFKDVNGKSYSATRRVGDSVPQLQTIENLRPRNR
jgi:hypothetical protein